MKLLTQSIQALNLFLERIVLYRPNDEWKIGYDTASELLRLHGEDAVTNLQQQIDNNLQHGVRSKHDMGTAAAIDDWKANNIINEIARKQSITPTVEPIDDFIHYGITVGGAYETANPFTGFFVVTHRNIDGRYTATNGRFRWYGTKEEFYRDFRIEVDNYEQV